MGRRLKIHNHVNFKSKSYYLEAVYMHDGGKNKLPSSSFVIFVLCAHFWLAFTMRANPFWNRTLIVLQFATWCIFSNISVSNYYMRSLVGYLSFKGSWISHFIMKSYFYKSLMTLEVLMPKKISLQPQKKMRSESFCAKLEM